MWTENESKKEERTYGKASQTTMCAAYDVVWRQWGQGRGEGWVSKRDEGRKSLDVPRRGGAGTRGGVWGRGGEGRVHTWSGGLRQRGDEGWGS